jgi:hypothetical protein
MIRIWENDFISDIYLFTWKDIAKRYKYDKPFIIHDNHGNIHLVSINRRMTTEDIFNLISKYGSGPSEYTLALVDPIRNTLDAIWLHRVNNKLMENATEGVEYVDYPVDIITPIGESHLYDLLVQGYTSFVM